MIYDEVIPEVPIYKVYVDGAVTDVPLDIIVNIPYVASMMRFTLNQGLYVDLGNLGHHPQVFPTYIKIISTRLLPIEFFWEDISEDRIMIAQVLHLADFLGDTEFVDRFSLRGTRINLDRMLNIDRYPVLEAIAAMYPELIKKIFGYKSVMNRFGSTTANNVNARVEDRTLNALIANDSLDVLNVTCSPSSLKSFHIYYSIICRSEKGLSIDGEFYNGRYIPIANIGTELHSSIMNSHYKVMNQFILQAMEVPDYPIPEHRLEQVELIE